MTKHYNKNKSTFPNIASPNTWSHVSGSAGSFFPIQRCKDTYFVKVASHVLFYCLNQCLLRSTFNCSATLTDTLIRFCCTLFKSSRSNFPSILNLTEADSSFLQANSYLHTSGILPLVLLKHPYFNHMHFPVILSLNTSTLWSRKHNWSGSFVNKWINKFPD